MITDLITTIYRQIPEYCTLSDQLDQVKQEVSRRAATPVKKDTRSWLASVGRSALEDMLAAGEPLEGLNARIALKDAENQAGQQAVEALRQMMELLKTQLKSLCNSPRTVSALNDALTEILDEIKTLEPITEISTDEAILASRRIDDAQRFKELVASITVLRREQHRILTAEGHIWSTKDTIAAAIRNVEDVYDDWAIWLQFGVLWNRRSDEHLTLRPPWPAPIGSKFVTDTFTLWALEAGAQMWIPTPDEYATYAEELRTKCREPRTDDRSNDRWVDPGTIGKGTGKKTSNDPRHGRPTQKLPAHIID